MTIIKKHDNALISATGHVHIEDDLGHVHLDDWNAIHPQNLARILTRALANETNSYIYRMAFGNGGSIVDALYDVTLKTPNDGLYPDVATWTSRLYNETYTEIITDKNATSENNAGNSGSNSIISTKDLTNPLRSKVVVTVVLGPGEPRSQSLTDNLPPQDVVDNTFTFDEIGLYSPGKSNVATRGRCDADIRIGTAPQDVTGLQTNKTYCLYIAVDQDLNSPTFLKYSFTTNDFNANVDITYEALMNILNSLLVGVTVSMTEPGTNVYDGYLKFISETVGSSSNVLIKGYGDLTQSEIDEMTAADETYLFSEGALTTFQQRFLAASGSDAGVEDNYADPSTERERLLTHITFVPVIKTANRTFVVTYTITIDVGQNT